MVPVTTRKVPMSNPAPESDPNRDLLCAVLDGGDIAVVRVIGRGCIANSRALKEFGNHVQASRKGLKFIVDLCRCDAMDSTFLGVMAGIAIAQTRAGAARMIVVNSSDHCLSLMKKLGLANGNLVDLRTGPLREIQRAESSFVPAESTHASREDQICLTLQAHKQLVDLDEQNEVRFEAVIEYLEKSLREEKSPDCAT